jgi:hypothetical protein
MMTFYFNGKKGKIAFEVMKAVEGILSTIFLIK